ncbi:condensation domain-containing protein [Streptomyces sp. NPDC048002]|uniref:phthiocerol/phthiodiolone dimycocerosyl transferase family protein n=1 Tax=Streptomyces sp. NPDC048002 TaxID=3154344 RepID=UPI0033E3B257
MRRALCPVETLYVGQRSRAVLSCTLRGRLDTGALSAAFDAVTGAHPSLRSRIGRDGEGVALHLLDEVERPRLDTRTGPVEDAHSAELNTPLSVGGPLSRAVLVSAPEGDRHLFVLSVDHTVVDGHSGIALHNELWDRYRALVEGGPGQQRPRTTGDPEWPVPVSRLLPPGDEAATAAYLERRAEEARRHPVELVPYDVTDPSGGEARIEVCSLNLDEERTGRLRRAARAVGVSVHALVAAALLTTARRHLPGDEPRTLGCLSPIDLRSRLSPPVPALVMVPAVTTHLQTLRVAPDTDPVELARTVHARVGEFVKGDGPYQEMRITPEIPSNPTLQLATVIATNMGTVPGPRLPEGLQAVDVRLVPAREHYFPAAGRSPVMACVVSFEGRLAIEFPYFTACFSPGFVRAFRDGTGAALAAFTDRTPEPSPAPTG